MDKDEIPTIIILKNINTDINYLSSTLHKFFLI
jgi:hypothetical protein